MLLIFVIIYNIVLYQYNIYYTNKGQITKRLLCSRPSPTKLKRTQEDTEYTEQQMNMTDKRPVLHPHETKNRVKQQRAVLR